MCASPVRKGQPAPFDGQCLTTDLAVKLAMKADSCDARIKIEVDFARRVERLDVGRLQQLMEIDKEANAQRIQLLIGQLEREQAWWRQPAFVAAATVVITIGVVVATGYALRGI